MQIIPKYIIEIFAVIQLLCVFEYENMHLLLKCIVHCICTTDMNLNYIETLVEDNDHCLMTKMHIQINICIASQRCNMNLY